LSLFQASGKEEFLLFVTLSAWISQQTKIGNWIFAVGSNAASPAPSACW
jgi:ribose/xylose/arabinose/galactoside ABC-type transport system permease subunit